MPDMSALLAQAQRMQEQLLAAKDELAAEVVEGTAAGGLVTARVNGTGELISLDIKPEVVDPDDTETLADVIVAAIRDAKAKAEERAAERIGGVAGGFGAGDLPGGVPGLPDSGTQPGGGTPLGGPIGFG
jgi:nucleoid-associated protein EbfC